MNCSFPKLNKSVKYELSWTISEMEGYVTVNRFGCGSPKRKYEIM